MARLRVPRLYTPRPIACHSLPASMPRRSLSELSELSELACASTSRSRCIPRAGVRRTWPPVSAPLAFAGGPRSGFSTGASSQAPPGGARRGGLNLSVLRCSHRAGSWACARRSRSRAPCRCRCAAAATTTSRSGGSPRLAARPAGACARGDDSDRGWETSVSLSPSRAAGGLPASSRLQPSPRCRIDAPGTHTLCVGAGPATLSAGSKPERSFHMSPEGCGAHGGQQCCAGDRTTSRRQPSLAGSGASVDAHAGRHAPCDVVLGPASPCQLSGAGAAAQLASALPPSA